MVQNNDIKVRATLTDGTNPYTISALNNYELYVYSVFINDKKLIATYKMGNTGVYGITIFDDVNGKVDFVINREMTRKLPDGTKLYLETRVQITAGSEFISSLQNLGANGVLIDTIISSANSSSLN